MSREDYDRGYNKVRRELGYPPVPALPEPGEVQDWYADACMERIATMNDQITALAGIPGPVPAAAEPAAQVTAKLSVTPDPVAEILAVLCEPAGLYGTELPDYRAVPSGTCTRCHRGPVYQAGLCSYCHELSILESEEAAHQAVAVPARCGCRECGMLRRVRLTLTLTVCIAVWVILALTWTGAL